MLFVARAWFVLLAALAVPSPASAQASPVITGTRFESQSSLPRATREAAHADALEAARAEVVALLRGLPQAVTREPSADEVRRLVRTSRDEQIDLSADPSVGRVMYRVHLCGELSPRDIDQLRDAERNERSRERMALAARVLAVVALAFGLFAGSVRLDELTKGFFSTHLKVGAVVMLAAGAAAAWLV